jgi:uncharacterized protein YkwD
MLKKWFFPHQQNDFHPYILRPLGTGIITLLVLLQPLIYNVITAHQIKLVSYATDISASSLLTLSNQERAGVDVGALQDNAQLDNAAMNKAEDMFAKDYWAHNSPTGETPWDFIAAAGYHYSAAAENLAMDFTTSEYVIDGWMNSPEHRINLLNSTYTDVGIAVMNGTLTGEQTTLVVMELAAPAVVAAPAPKTPAATPTPIRTTPAAAQSPPVVQATPPATAQPIQPKPTTTKTVPTTMKPAVSSTPMKTSLLPTKPVSLSLTARLANAASLNWGQRATILLLSTLLLANVLTHTIVWRKQKRGWKHIWLRAHPILQASMLCSALLVVLLSGYGVVV